MFSHLSRFIPRHCALRVGVVRYSASTSSKALKVTVLGASGGIGQPLALMLKQSPLIDELSLYDIQYAKGVGLDVSHLDTRCKVCAFQGPLELDDALQDSKIVIFLGGVARKPGMTREDLFKTNADITKELAEACVRVCPQALIAIVTNPVNSLVPLVFEVFDAANVQANCRIFGVTSLDVVRANTFVAEILGIEPECVVVPVVGGHSGKTILPLISQSTPQNEFKEAEIQMLTHAIQEAGTVIVKAKGGSGSATLSIAFACARFTIALIKGLCGQPNVVECAYVRSDCVPDVKYFATPIELGPGGVQRNLGLPKMSEYECALMSAAIPELKKDISKGESFITDSKKKNK